MASITIRNLDDGVKTELRKRAAGNGRSMEEEVRLILGEGRGARGRAAEGLGNGDSRTVQTTRRGRVGIAAARPDARTAPL